ncbi:phenolphthiocerol synthesis polyketide synthase type I Pks15/1-like [Folsomia candida]|uniref:phenolphthiocerol synthesis polyketide synthase type I Pks15/1-like n=1 Tax=Folsomia candida TaxID=158441 RepID=UPI000B8FAF37|nr:phenolphthiocerol synthesis polyketide synthase type I Pks15/1-like [Folsomia candida]
MSSCLKQHWVSYAGDEGEVWKCVLLARALRRSLTTRPLVVIVSDNVSHDLGRRLQGEVGSVFWAEPVPGVLFRSVAKRVAGGLKGLHKAVFLDCACLPLKNCDDLFRTHGVQWVREDKAVVLTKSRSLAAEDHDLITELVVQRENGGKFVAENPGKRKLEELSYCAELDFKSAHPTPVPGKDMKMVCFVNGHPHDQDVEPFRQRGVLEEEVMKLCVSLCPEIHSAKVVVNGPALDGQLVDWELHNSIAIVGMACRYPCANTIAEFWSLLANGLEGIRKVPEGRWTKDKAFIRMDNMGATEAGFLSCPIHTFDAKFFNTNAADIHYLDPQQRLSLRVVWEALEHAGLDPNTLRNTLTGVFGGWWRNDYKEMLQMLGIPDTDFLRGYMGNALGPLTARISHFFELMGPSFSTESGCSTSVAGVDMACDSLRSDACNLAIAVGANLLLHPFSPSVMEGVLAPDGRCKTYDASADGFGRAEGIGVLILKRFSDAVADGDTIWGCIRGSAIVQEGPSKSMGTPTVDVEAKAMELALERAGVDPNDVEFVETHGTGTPVGDPIEIAAVAKAYSRGSKGRTNVLTIGSVKTNIGHTESVCGIAGIQKSVLAMKHELIPKHLHLKNLNPDINLDAIPAQLPLEAVPWKRRPKGGKPRIAGVNSFGITGAQAHVLVQEPPENLPPHSFPFTDSRKLRMLTFSAKSEEAFRFQVKAYADLLKNLPDTNEPKELFLRDIEYSMHTGRPHMHLRQVAFGSTKEELLSSMEGIRKGAPIPNQVPQLCFLFTGQGSQYPGMARSLYEQSIVFRSNFDWCESVLSKEHGLLSLKTALWEEQKLSELNDGQKSLLKSSLYSQTSIFVVEFCLLRLWESWGVKPDAVLGHSLGEFAAAVAAGMLSAEDALKLVVTRSKLIHALPAASMLVVGTSLEKVEQSLERAFSNQKKWLDVAAVNSESQTVLAGPTDLVHEFKLYCDNNDIKTHVLDASHAFHSHLMDPMLAEYEALARTIGYKEASTGIKFISAVDGRTVSKVDAKYWVRHTRERVRFLEASHAAVNEGQSLFLEVGPHPVLSTLLMTNVDEVADVVTSASLRRKCDDWETMLAALGKLYALGRPITWANFHRYSGGRRVELPGYHFEETPYWMNIKDEGSNPFHPLLGSFVPNPSDVTIFKSSVNVHRLPFLKDHALGDKIIFPCVGYVDMCMTAGYAATMCNEGSYIKPTSPLCVRNFSILTPVCLSEMTPTEFQVVVSRQSAGEINTSIFTKVYLEDSTYKWVKNAVGNFVSSPPVRTLIASEEFGAIKARCTELVRVNFDYRELEEFGFNFGPSCHTVSPGCKNPENSGEWLFPFRCHESQEDHERFIVHPWVTDPMLQSQIMALGLLHDTQVRKRLVVPVSIDNFTWWGHSAPSGYIHIKHGDGGNEAHLYSEEGILMVSMLGTEFMETTLANILSLIDSQKNPYPSLAEFTWKEKLGPEERRIPDAGLESISIKDVTFNPKDSAFTAEEFKFYTEFNILGGLYMLKAMKELGLDKEETFTWPEISEKIGVLPLLSKFLRYILLELGTEGWVSAGKCDTFSIPKPFPSVEALQAKISSLAEVIREGGVGLTELSSTQGVWQVLAQILTGRTSALPLLFPDGSTISTKGPAEVCYTESVFAHKRYALNEVEGALLSQLSTLGGSKSVVRILEVGAGVGSETTHLLKHMSKAGVAHFEYTYTDLAPSFLQKGETLFAESGISAKFRVLDVEKDPMAQGFTPKQYDVIVASWVLHATKNIEESVANLILLLRPGGYFLITELVEPTRAVKLLFGGLEGFWKFDDTKIRPWHCELSVKGWHSLLETNGFEVASLESYAGANALIVAKLGESNKIITKHSWEELSVQKLGHTWILFGDTNPTSPSAELQRNLEAVNCHIVRITLSDIQSGCMETKVTEILQHTFTLENVKVRGLVYSWALNEELTTAQICEPFLYICKYLVKVQSSLRVVALTRGNMSTGGSDFYLKPPIASPLIAMVNVLANENMDLSCKCVDIDPNPKIERPVSDAWNELFATDADVMVAYRAHQRCTPRLRPYKVKTSPLPIPNTPRYKLVLPPSHIIQDLQFTPCEPEPLGESDVEVEVKAYALNFLDVLMVTKPDPVFEKYNYLGVDIAGVVTAVGANTNRKVGERVVVVRRHGLAMPSHIISPGYRTCIIPDDITFSEAATFPMGLLTVATCLVDVAKAGPGDVVLIHTASGGVGLIGIQIAQRLGATVVVTAGNEKKRNYLRSLGVKHVFNSRSTEYEKDIRASLGGRGVTIVMNSLTSPGFKEATLNLCEKGARFVEMSKMNIWSKEDVEKLRPDVYYEVVDVSTLSDEKLNELAVYLQDQLLRRIEDRPTPLPFTRFNASEIRDALEYMEKVKHIGKIVLVMPDQGVGKEQTFHLFDGRSTYMITGGLGGIGLEVAKWMATTGAQNFLLLGRSAPKPEALDKIEKLRRAGVRIETRSVDVGIMEELQQLMTEFDSGALPPLRGIMHAAGVLDDATYENQTWDKFENVFNCKVQGAWNLHQLSLNLTFPLEHFVLFSSMTATIGAVAQSNYAAANQYLDSLVHYRSSLGLPGTAVNWGQWGQVGLAANLHVALNKPLTIHQGTAALEHALTSHKTQLMAHESDLGGYKAVLPSCKGLLVDFEEDSVAQGEIDGDEFWREYDGAINRDAKCDIVRRFLKRLIRITLKMDKNEEIEDQVNFQDMGFDSLLMVEMKNGLQASVGKRVKISINAVKDCKTVAQLTDRLVELISGKEDLPPPTAQELQQLVAMDSTLPESIRVDASLVGSLTTPITKITTVLVLGCTGTLGPYIVAELFKRRHIQKVICIMQSNPMISPLERFRRIYEKKGLLSDIDMDRIECIVGDIKDHHFGLVEPVYRHLCTEVDAVFNLAVKVAFEEVYRCSEDPKSSRVTNVFGMRNVLQFAVDKKLKYVYHASTFAAETRVDDDGYFWEGWPAEEEVAMFPNSAYSISKLICDRLAEQAVAAGVPCKVFRLPQLGGDSVRGGNIQLDSFLMMRFLAYLYIGSMHGVRIPLSLMAVDQCAKLSIDLFFNDKAGYEMFNVLNPHLGDEREFETLAKEFGVAVQVMDSTDFLEKWKKMDSSDEMIQLVKFAMTQEQELFKLRDDKMPYYVSWLNGNDRVFMSKKLQNLMPEEYPNCITSSKEILRRDLRHARDTGVFDRYKIKHSNPYLLS